MIAWTFEHPWLTVLVIYLTYALIERMVKIIKNYHDDDGSE